MSGRLVLVIGGSGSGKSAYAEKFLLAQAGGRAVYLAAMENTGDEAQQRIARHRAMRATHGAAAGRTVVTIQRPEGIGGADLLPGCAARGSGVACCYVASATRPGTGPPTMRRPPPISGRWVRSTVRWPRWRSRWWRSCAACRLFGKQ